MRNITKQLPLQELSQYRRQFDATYKNLSKELKKSLKEKLLHEQGHLCCYCMQRISFGSMRVEHWQCRNNYPERELDYENLLAACPGIIGAGPHAEAICDVRKKDRDLTYNPAAYDVEHLLQYKKDGTIFSEADRQFSQELDDVLNLNCGLLRNNRAAVYDVLINVPKKWTPAALQNKIMELENADILTEYLGLKVYILKKWLQRLQKRN